MNGWFSTSEGLLVSSVDEDQMREVDRIAIDETGPALFQMMENAGRNLALQCLSMLGSEWKSSTIVVLAGTGGNGGGGICAARHLANRGANVHLCVSSVERLGDVPKYQRHIYQGTTGKECSLEELPAEVDIVIDAILGYSLKGAPRGIAFEMIKWANAAGAPLLSLDIPSGVNSTTGETPGEFIKATTTMTLALPKTGLHNSFINGNVMLADIGIPQKTYDILGIDYQSPFGSEYRIPLNFQGDHS
ncbi:hypothetical protein BSKO_00598 [Bryopsis sp. KO-2023]|nr:hypothetical protein BSKO_00598 [Bryopsis sp. KO-2023]